jgi:hypothetical protein
MTKKFPSIAPRPGISTPRVVGRVFGEPKHLLPGKIRVWRSTDIDEQHRLFLQAKDAEIFWNLRMRNKP